MIRPLSALTAFLVFSLLLAPEESMASDAERSYRLAMAMAAREDFPRAAAEFAKFLESHPRDERAADAGFWRGYCLHKAARHEEAVAVYAEWIARNGGHQMADRALYWQAESLSALRKPEEARAIWRRLAADYPKSPRAANALEALAWSHYEAGDHETALRVARDLKRRFPEMIDMTVKAARLAGEIEIRLGRPALALAEFDFVLDQQIDMALEAEMRFGRASALQALGRHDDAAREFSRVVALAAREPAARRYAPEALLAQASSLVSAGKAEDALKVIWDLEHRPDRGSAGIRSGFWMGLAQERLGKTAEAKKAYEAVLARPEAGSVHGRAAWQLAELRLADSDAIGAVAAYDRVIESGEPADLVDRALYNVAVTLSDLGRNEEALARLERLTREHRQSPLIGDALFGAGEFLVRMGRYRDAADRYGEFLLRFPTDRRAADVRFRRGWCLHATGSKEAARAELEALLRLTPRGPNAAQASQLLGDIARGKGELRAAVEHYRRSVDAGSRGEDLAETLWALASVLKDLGRLEEAEAAAEALANGHAGSPLVPWARVLSADVALGDNRLDAALARYRAAIAEWPGHELEAAALSGEAWTLFKAGRKDEALQAFRHLAELHPETRFGVEALYRAAVILREAGRAGEAEATLKELRRRSPDGRFAEAGAYEQALALKAAGDLGAALTALRDFEAAYPRSDLLPDVLREMALIHYGRRDTKAEAQAWKRIVDSFGRSAAAFDAHFGLGAIAEEAGDLDAALGHYTRAMSAALGDPRASLAGFRRGEVLVGLGRQSDAQKIFVAVADEFRDSEEAPKCLARAGVIALDAGRASEALGLLERAEALAPGSALLPLARALRENGRHAEAADALARHLNSAAAGAAETRKARLELALSLSAQGKYEEAAKELRQIIGKAEDALAARAQYELGELLVKSGKLKEADGAFYEVVLLYPYEEWRAKARYKLGEINERLRDFARAREFYAELVRENPDSPLVSQARARLVRLGP